MAVAGLSLAGLASLATAGDERSQKEPDLKIAIVTVDHADQRYPTVGDWVVVPGGIVIKVSRMSDQRYEFLIALHELVEAYLCKQAGITPEAVDTFDKSYGAARPKGDDGEPGDDPKAPYHRQHVFATKIERLMAKELGVNWNAYDKEVLEK